jgi:LysR family hydrogen peroxide-inducible transcriptional activator
MTNSGITRHQLNCLESLLRHRSFAIAAEQLHISQPALTMQIQKLESLCGFTLVDRQAKPLQLTVNAQLIMPIVNQILDGFAELDDSISGVQNRLEGELRLGVIPTIAPYYMPDVVGPFVMANPLVRLQVREMTTEKVLEALQVGDIDLGVVALPMAQDCSAFETHRLFEEALWVYHSGQPDLLAKTFLELSELDDYTTFLLSEGHCLRDHVLMICGPRSLTKSQGLEYQSGSLETLVHLVDQYGGLTVIPEMTRKRMSEEQRVRTLPLDALGSYRSIVSIHRKTGYKKRLVMAFNRVAKNLSFNDLSLIPKKF